MSNVLRNCFSEQLHHFTSLAAMYEGSSFPIFAKTCYLSFFLRFYLLLERGEREGERKGEKHQCVVASHVSRTGDLACNPGICPDWESNWRSFGSQPGAQSTEPHQPGPGLTFEIRRPGFSLWLSRCPALSRWVSYSRLLAFTVFMCRMGITIGPTP